MQSSMAFSSQDSLSRYLVLIGETTLVSLSRTSLKTRPLHASRSCLDPLPPPSHPLPIRCSN